MTQIGYALSSEEHAPQKLVEHARRAEEVGFPFALISDHFHPWIDRQGQSPFVWSVIGAIAQETSDLRLGTGVTCPTFRTHPAIIAQAAATCAEMMPGRFFLGVGTGENLNEHVTGFGWPVYDLRAPMLEEAVQIIRELWLGETITFYGDFYDVVEARIYTLPEELPTIHMAASGPNSAALAGEISDGLISTAPVKDWVDEFNSSADRELERTGKLTVCWAQSREEALATAFEWWPNAAISGELSQELRTPTHFEQALQMVTEDDMPSDIVLGKDVDEYLASIQEFLDAGFTRVYIHQIGPDQEGFFKFYGNTLRAEIEKL